MCELRDWRRNPLVCFFVVYGTIVARSDVYLCARNVAVLYEERASHATRAESKANPGPETAR